MSEVRLPIGINDFAELRSGGYYYIDKTSMIEDLLEHPCHASSITRPPRFGKSVNMSMLAEFFDLRKDSRKIFTGLKIMENTELCEEWMNKWPVLFLSFSEVEGENFQASYEKVQDVIADLCRKHTYLLESPFVSERDKERFERLLKAKGNSVDVKLSLKALTRMMEAHYGESVILIIDELDAPLVKANDNGYYYEMLDVVEPMLGNAVKSNKSLEFAVMSGCLRVTPRSFYTSLNQIKHITISSHLFQSHFGFTEAEVEGLLRTAGLEERLPEIRKKYNGYRFDDAEVYNPCDVLNCVSDLMADPNSELGDYWRETSDNSTIKKILRLWGSDVNGDFELLLAGKTIVKPIRESLNYDDAYLKADNLWSLLYLTGFLTRVPPKELPEEERPGRREMALCIPNEEVRGLFSKSLREWLDEN